MIINNIDELISLLKEKLNISVERAKASNGNLLPSFTLTHPPYGGDDGSIFTCPNQWYFIYHANTLLKEYIINKDQLDLFVDQPKD